MDILKRLSIFLIFAFSISCGAQDFSTTKNVSSGEILAPFLSKPYTLFYFWATWCPDCKEKLGHDLSSYTNKIVDLLSIATDKDLEKIENYLQKNKVGVPVFHDPNKQLQKYFKVFSVPTIVLAKKSATGFEMVATVTGKDWTEIDRILKGAL